MRVIVGVVLAASVLSMLGCSSAGGGNSQGSAASAAPAPSKPNITEMSASLVVGQESFPVVAGAYWKAPYVESYPSDGKISPMPDLPECVPLVAGPAHGENTLARAALKGESRNPDFKVELTLPSGQPPDWNALVDKCGVITMGDRHDTFHRLSSDQLPQWAVGTRAESNNGYRAILIFGNYRGVVIFVQAAREPDVIHDDAAAATKMFNDQVAKLGAA